MNTNEFRRPGRRLPAADDHHHDALDHHVQAWFDIDQYSKYYCYYD